MVGHTFVYSTPVRKIKEIVDHGDIGDFFISVRRAQLGIVQKDINVAWDLAPHTFPLFSLSWVMLLPL
jgi:predicted dehydrogenase